MPIQRAVVQGNIAGAVQIRNMFTADITLGGVYSYQQLWTTYLGPIYTEICVLMPNIVHFTQFEIQIPDAGHWVPFAVVPFVHTGSEGGEYLPYLVAAVLLAKAPGLRHVGRKFFGPIAETHAINNGLTTTGLSYAAAALLAYITPMTSTDGGTLTPGVTDKAGNFHAFAGGVVSSLLGTMRRRKPGIGI